MRFVQIYPKEAWHSNGLLRGGAPGIGTLPISRRQQVNIETGATMDVMDSFYPVGLWDRLKFLFNGKIYVSIVGKTHPPLSVGIGDLYPKKGEDEEVTDPYL